jgi:transcriptional regulator with XRE-family HTH domain
VDLLGVSLPTAQKWEQGRKPNGPAKKLLQIASRLQRDKWVLNSVPRAETQRRRGFLMRVWMGGGRRLGSVGWKLIDDC